MEKVEYYTLIDFIKFLKNRELLLRIFPYIYDKDETEYYGLKQKIEHQDSLLYKRTINIILNCSSRKEKLAMLKQFLKEDNIVIDCLRNIDNPFERRFLLNELFDNREKDIYYPSYSRNFTIPNYKTSLPADLKFGIEIECFGDSLDQSYYIPIK